MNSHSDSFSWLHLTDFHYGLKGQGCLWPTLRQVFLEDLAKIHSQTGPWQAVLFTGDFVQSGEAKQYTEMQFQLLDRIWDTLKELGSGKAILLAVPGNHDLYRPDPKQDDAGVDALLSKNGFRKIAEKFWANSNGPYRSVISKAFKSYSDWWHKSPQRPKNGLTAGILPGDFAYTFKHGRRSIGIVGLNTTFLQLKGGNYQGRLVWDAAQIHAVCNNSVDEWTAAHDVCLLLTHQGTDWLTPDCQSEGDSEIAPPGRFALHLFGHMHETRLSYIHRTGAGEEVRQLQGPSVFGMEMFGNPPKHFRSHGYVACRIDFKKNGPHLRIWPRLATKKTGGWRYIPDHEHASLEQDQGTKSAWLGSGRSGKATKKLPKIKAGSKRPSANSMQNKKRGSIKTNTEKEIKLKLDKSIQARLTWPSTMASADDLASRLKGLFRFAGFSVEDQGSVDQNDRYYDTQDMRLEGINSSIRVREIAGHLELTVKKPLHREPGIYQRQQKERCITKLKLRTLEKTGFKEIVASHFAVYKGKSLQVTAIVKNKRQEFVVARNSRAYRVSVDNIVFEDPNARKSGGGYLELEIEAIHDASPEDLKQLREAMVCVFPELTASDKTKYEAALAFYRRSAGI
jgi:hypothetical protein